MSELNPCELLAAFVAGDLNEAEHDAFVEHLATCSKCQDDFPEMVVLHDALLRSSEPPRAKVVPAPAARLWWSRSGLWAAAIVVLTIAGALAVVQLRECEDERSLAEHEAAGAFEALSAILENEPAHAAARWNAALALRELGLIRSAALELEKIAEGGEPGRSEEARALAGALRARIEARDRARDELRVELLALQSSGELERERGRRFTAAAYAREVELLRAVLGAAR